MLKWTKCLIEETVLAFNEGETQKAIAERLNVKTKTISRLLCRARDGIHGQAPKFVERRSAPVSSKKKGPGKCVPPTSSN